jgi:hypothetical protein
MAKSYYSRRWQNTKLHTWPGFTWALGLVQIMGLGGAIVSSYLLGGYDFTLGELKSWGMFTFAWLVIANLSFLAFNWWMSPSRLAQQDSDRIAALELAQQSDRRRIGIKDKLGVALDGGRKLMAECRAEGIERTDLEDRANKWYEGLQNFVTACFGEGEANYLRHGVDGGVVYSDGSKPNEDLRLNIQRALKQLTHILQGADTKPIRDDFKI